MLKNKKNKYILYTLISLSLISVVSVGFSSWIINNSKGDTTENFNITFGEVIDNTISANITSSDVSVSFDALEADLCTNEITNGDGNVEDLNYGVTFTLTSANSLVGINLDFTYSNTSNFISALGTNPNDYINCACLTNFTYTMPIDNVSDATNTENTAVKLNVTYSNGTKTSATIEANFAFSWGSVFGNVNPCKSEIDNVDIKLNSFKTAYSKVINEQINLTITPKISA